MNEIQNITVSIPFCDVSFEMKLINKGHNVPFYDIIKNNKIYEPETTKFICKTLHDNFNCIDIGANNGYYTILMSILGAPNTSVYSYEPMPDSYKLLLDNVKGRNNVHTFNVALSSVIGSMELNFETEADGTASGIKLPSHRNRIKVPVTTLDRELIDKSSISISKPTLIKIDVEGFEPEVISGGRKLLSGLDECYVIFEYMKDYYSRRMINYDALFDVFHSMDYQVFLLINDGTQLKRIKDHREIGSLNANLVAIKK